ncbi:hypothetical protein PBCVNEJV1_669L [Paramecium bursaria Chlorella virus NE-JV-1]|nr:hypothetical protein PBCVNEJV1_669L [Paramecium bursaria Chlorella virus NE-JV-1]
MFYASLSEAFGVDSLEKTVETPKRTTKVERVKFPADLVTPEEDDDDVPTMIPEERKITSLEVKKYLRDVYKKQGVKKVWNMLDPRIQKKILESCNKSIDSTKKWFDDILTSPEKLLILLAMLFVFILLLDSTSKKAEAPVSSFRPDQQYFYYPQQFSSQPIDLRW